MTNLSGGDGYSRIHERLNSFEFVLQQLLSIQSGIDAVTVEKLLMVTLFHDSAFVQYHDDIGILDGRDTVRDQDRRSFLNDTFELRENPLFGLSINAGECVIQDQDRWIREKRSRNRGSLSLAP